VNAWRIYPPWTIGAVLADVIIESSAAGWPCRFSVSDRHHDGDLQRGIDSADQKCSQAAGRATRWLGLLHGEGKGPIPCSKSILEVELRGFEPLTPSMRTQCSSGQTRKVAAFVPVIAKCGQARQGRTADASGRRHGDNRPGRDHEGTPPHPRCEGRGRQPATWPYAGERCGGVPVMDC
jgi:hypothetical protein